MTDPIDVTRIEEFSDGTPEGLRQLVELFLEDSRETLSAMTALLAGSDRGALTLLAHRFRGTCSVVGAEPLARQLTELEQHAAQLPGPELAARMAGIEREVGTAITFLTAYLEGQRRP
jgi:HPt (histidine-containing phosphotransfer) domain-containing protein